LKNTVILAIAFVASAAQAQPKPQGESSVVQRLVACRDLTDDAAQLACYRQATEALVRAQSGGDIVIVDREDARTVRRQAFGLSLPSLSLFEKGESDESLNTLVSQVRAARQDSAGRWIVQLDDGATWTQVETLPLRTAPKAGMPVTISRAALGSYKMKVGEQRAVRARRIE
jgi:hypothetical protein